MHQFKKAALYDHSYSLYLSLSAVTIIAPQAAPAPPAPSDLTGSRSATIKWNEADTKPIVSWLSERDGGGVRHNLDEWNKGNKQHAAEKMLSCNRVDKTKEAWIRKKASDKIKGMH